MGQLKTAIGREAETGPAVCTSNSVIAYDAAGNLSQRTNNALVQTFNVNV